jgi:hypothetical protein
MHTIFQQRKDSDEKFLVLAESMLYNKKFPVQNDCIVLLVIGFLQFLFS